MRSTSRCNLLKCRDEEKLRTEVKPLDKAHAVSLDDNEVWSKIRLLRFEEDIVGQYLDSEVSTDPGSEVFKNGVAFFVVKSNGGSLLCESPQTGAQHWFDIKDLTPGRRAHSNSHNYQKGKVVGSFDAGAKAHLARGDFIWISPLPHIALEYTNITRQLACIQMLDGGNIVGFAAVDGTAFKIPISDSDVRPVSDTLNAYLNEDRNFQVFKESAVHGGETERLAAGKHRDLTLICLGFAGGQDKTEKVDWREKLKAKYHDKREMERAQARFTKNNVDVKGDGGLKERLDNAKEAVKLGGDPDI